MSPFLPLYLPWLLLLFLLPLLLLLHKLKNRNLPPGPPKLPIIGNLHQLGNMPHHSITKLAQKYGPVMLMKLGRVSALFISSPEMATEIMKTQDLSCCTRAETRGVRRISYNLRGISFSPYKDYWRELRRIAVNELLTAKKVKLFVPVMEQKVARFIDDIAQSTTDSVNLSDRLFILLDSIICTVACGKSYEGTQFEDGEHGDVINDALSVLASFSYEDFFPGVGWIFDSLTGYNSQLEKVFWKLDKFYERVINDHLDPARPSPENEDVIDVLLGLYKNQTSNPKLTMEDVKAVLMDIFLGGVDTSSITTGWTMAELIKNPRVMKKLQAEIKACVGNKQMVQHSDTVNIPYLHMVIKETFRLHPPSVFLIPRVTMNHIKIGGYDVKPGTRVHINVYGIGRDPKIWKNPDEYYPERFEGSNIDFRGQHSELLPFGAGRRMCPAIPIGSSILEVTIANLVHRFDWELPGGINKQDLSMEESFSLTVHKKVPLCLVPVKRKFEN